VIVEGSTLPCAGLTAWFALVEKGSLMRRDRAVEARVAFALFGLQIAQGAWRAPRDRFSRSAERKWHVLERWAPDNGIDRSSETGGGRLSAHADPGADHILESSAGAHLGKAGKGGGGRAAALPDRRVEGFEVAASAGR